ncbi:hypothetical protein [Xenococcus sp. PCC 7305]|uniref:hypothetical protein n=1 Tax=Xenococcus sp. PCC 7305 TaxID=102125 RepID=UPI0002ED9CC2|nr:hypothetical protein [Xenococcus sp. PCC 7305]
MKPKQIINVANRLITAFMLLIAVIVLQNASSENTNQVREIRIEKEENKIINLYSNSYPAEKKSLF